MLFRRRRPLKLHQKLSHFMWPRRGWGRALRYHSKRLMRMSGSPHSIAAGFASGVALSMTPFIGFHYLLSFAAAFLVRGNVVAALLGTTLGNPLTFPFIWLATFETGNVMLGWFGMQQRNQGIEDLSHKLLHESLSNIWPIIESMMLGAIPIAIVIGGISYVVVYLAAEGFQTSRRERFAIRRRQLHGTHF
jgi:uncharacterized protein (DUF2062 family)